VAPSSGLAGGDLAGAGTFGRRYRPLDNGRLANTGERVKNLSEEQKIAKLADLKKSAEEYEGMLMAEMIKSMRQSAFVKTPGGDTYSEIAEKPFTAAITAAGGLGLSETIVSQVAAQEGLDDILAAHPEAMGPNWRQRLSPSQMPKPGPRPAGRVGEAKPAGSAPEGARTAGRDQASQAGLASQTSQTSQATQAGQTAPGDNPEGAGS
jgi:Rod binding domain-containing protein